jgi:hypothetical protein
VCFSSQGRVEGGRLPKAVVLGGSLLVTSNRSFVLH